MTYEQVAKKLGMTVDGVYARAKARGIEPSYRVGVFRNRRSVIADWSESQVSTLSAPVKRKEEKDG